MFAGYGEYLNSTWGINLSLILSAACITWMSWRFFRELCRRFPLRTPVWTVNALIVATVGLSIHMTLNEVNYVMALLFFFFIDVLLIRLVFKGKMLGLLFAFAYASIHILAFEGVVFCIGSWINRIPLQDIVWIPVLRAQVLGYTFLLTGIFFWVLEKFKFITEWEYLLKKDNGLGKIMLGVEALVIILLMLETGVYYVPIEGYAINFFYLTLNLMIVAVFHLVFNYTIQNKRLMQETVAREDMLGRQLTMQLQNYQKQVDYVEYFRSFKHDYRNQLRGLLYLVDKDADRDRVKSYIMELTHTLEDITAFYHPYSDNLLLDAILQDGKRYCDEKQIEFSAVIHVKDNFHMSDIDFCTVFSNVLNNAIEAAEGTPEGVRRFVSLQSVEKGAWSGIRCTNSFDGIIVREEGEIVTRKEDSPNHGFGLAKIKSLVEAAGGMVSIEVKDGTFTLRMMMHQ